MCLGLLRGKNTKSPQATGLRGGRRGKCPVFWFFAHISKIVGRREKSTLSLMKAYKVF